MRCTTPKRIPLRALRDRATRRDSTLADAAREVSCGKCLACRMNRHYTWAYRIVWEVDRCDLPCWFLTLTYDDEHLPMSKARVPGELTEPQAGLLRKWEARDAGGYRPSPGELQRREELVARMASGAPALATASKKDVQDWKKRVGYELGRTPRMLSVTEYGTRRGRPHAHVVVFGATEGECVKAREAWGKGITHAYLMTDRLASYIAKDVTKGTHEREKFIARGVEVPAMLYPKRPQLAASQEDWLVKMLSRAQEVLTAQDFEARVTLKGLGGWYRRGGYFRRIGDTAKRKAFERLTRESESHLNAKEAERLAAYDHTRWTDIEGPDYWPEYAEKHEAEMKSRKRASERTRARHERIIQGKKTYGL